MHTPERMAVRPRFRAAVASIGFLASAACATGRTDSARARSARPDSALLRADVEYLASDALQGRATGTAGNDSAAAFAARRYESLRLIPVVPGYLQRFTARPSVMAHDSAGVVGLPTQNVVAMVEGSDPAVRGQFIVVGAHIDHLGRLTRGALDPEAGSAIRNGADDNASGTAGVLELARLIAARPARRSVVFVNFSGEELGLLGSQYFVEHSPVRLDSITAMLNFDMIGRMRGDSVIVYGVASAVELPALLDSASSGIGLFIRGVGDGFGPSDHSSFFARGIPVLHFFTNLHEDYHRATDDAEKINAQGLARVVGLAERVIRRIDDSGRLTFVPGAARPAVAGARTGSNVYLGSIPDMSAGDVEGLRLTGVRSGSPADSAGLRLGDIVVEFGGKRVTNLQTYSDALYSFKPGDEVDVVVLRGEQRLTLRVRLGRRG